MLSEFQKSLFKGMATKGLNPASSCVTGYHPRAEGLQHCLDCGDTPAHEHSLTIHKSLHEIVNADQEVNSTDTGWQFSSVDLILWLNHLH